MPCRIAFERGKERHFCFLAISLGESGWVVLAEELPLKQHYGVVRVAAPLAGSNVCYSSTAFCAIFPTLISNLCQTFIAIVLPLFVHIQSYGFLKHSKQNIIPGTPFAVYTGKRHHMICC